MIGMNCRGNYMSSNKVFQANTDRGNFKTIFEISKVGMPIEQVSMSKTFPGVIKAWHHHKNQTDVWYVVSGNIRAKTYDENKRELKEYFLGEDYDDNTLLIHPPLWHGYQVLGDKPAVMLYLLDQEYDPKDEYRADYNCWTDWEVKNR